MKKLLLIAILFGLGFVVYKYGNIDTKSLKKDATKVTKQATEKVADFVKNNTNL